MKNHLATITLGATQAEAFTSNCNATAGMDVNAINGFIIAGLIANGRLKDSLL
ncbi:MAG: hypothetical protein ACJAVI_003993 [Candidatus Azotimanducaceae bacterium]|jgi:hypothetical protein